MVCVNDKESIITSIDAEDKARYEKDVETWNKNHPDDLLIFDGSEVAVKQSKLKELRELQQQKQAKAKEKKLKKKAAKARKYAAVAGNQINILTCVWDANAIAVVPGNDGLSQ